MSAASRALNIGVIGLGRAATSMLPSLAAHPDVRLVAAADPRAEARDAFARQFGGQTFVDAADLLDHGSVDAVYIATPHQVHAQHVIMAAERGKHAICEKPMALTLDDCDAMIDAVERAGTHLVIGPTHGFDRPVLKMHEILRAGTLGRARMILTFDYTNFLYRPRRPEELDTRLGGGIIFNQTPHQVDTVRLLGGGVVRSVRSMTGIWDPLRPTEGSHMTFLEFEDGTAATMVYSAYDRFDSDELFGWVGEGGSVKASVRPGAARRALRAAGVADESALKAATGFGGANQKRAGGDSHDGSDRRHHPHFGHTIVSCEGGDMRTSPDGVTIYDDDGQREVSAPLGPATPDKSGAIDELVLAVRDERPPLHDGRWGRATLEVCLAILESARQRREVVLADPVRNMAMIGGGNNAQP